MKALTRRSVPVLVVVARLHAAKVREARSQVGRVFHYPR